MVNGYWASLLDCPGEVPDCTGKAYYTAKNYEPALLTGVNIFLVCRVR